MSSQTKHETFTIKKHIKAAPHFVFKAWADPAAREIWGPPSNEDKLQYTETDFRVGGTDTCLCGPEGNLAFQVKNHYLDIQNNERLIFTESIFTEGALLSTSLATIEIIPRGAQSDMLITVQLVSLVGEEMTTEVKGGWSVAIENLEKYLSQA